MPSKSLVTFVKASTLIIKNLYFSENFFKKPSNLSKCLTLLEKASI
jgi:hypothetical protein